MQDPNTQEQFPSGTQATIGLNFHEGVNTGDLHANQLNNMPLTGQMSPSRNPRDGRTLSTSFLSRASLTSAMQSMSTSYRKAVGLNNESEKRELSLVTPPASPPQPIQSLKRPVSTTATDILYIQEDVHAEVTVIQRAIRMPIVTQSKGNLREVIYHEGRPTYR